MGVNDEINVQRLWEQYEGIAMHFNDLLIRLRTQSLAGVAAISAVVGIFAREGGAGDIHLDWDIVQAIFLAMTGFWIAIWCLDIGYYNRLLSGAVDAIEELEKKTAPDGQFTGEIDMSRTIVKQFDRDWWNWRKRSYDGVVSFYVIVLALLLTGFWFAHSRV
jgi:hypothetical protein